ncbi:hypothetical protein AB0J82_36765 [Asanoa sp. NPDC049518]|uniref:hypothetical protein n=1 Tax=unclassified Asanoa TaxID=2685164 RepID=UPI0034129B87
MPARTLIAVPAPGGGYTARSLAKGGYTACSLAHGGHPSTLVPVLRRIWTQTFAHNTQNMTTALLARDWHALDADPRPTHDGAAPPVPGLGFPSPGADIGETPGMRNERIGTDVEWLYLIHVDRHLLDVHEATVHHTWLRHGLYHLNPIEDLFDLFALEGDPGGGRREPMTVCTVCGAVDETEYHQLPSMAGFGYDTVTICGQCGSSVATDPMFGAHITRRPWPAV